MLYFKKYCKIDYNELKKDFYVKNDCFGVNYIYKLLIDGYDFGFYRKIRVVNLLNGFDLGWILGVVLYNIGILNV